MRYKFDELFHVYFPRVDLTIIIHELAFDIPQFVEEHRSVGFLSEKEGESLHHELNLESAQFSCFRGISQSVEEHRSVVQVTATGFEPTTT